MDDGTTIFMSDADAPTDFKKEPTGELDIQHNLDGNAKVRPENAGHMMYKAE